MDKFRFENFELDRTHRTLTRDGEPLNLNSKALDLLAVLVQQAPSVVSKDELLAQVWPDQIVEENNLTVQMSALRKLLGDGNGTRFIRTVPGKGYSFVAPVEQSDREIIVEQRTFERIVVEDDPDQDLALPAANSVRRVSPILIFGTVIAILAVISTVVIYRWNTVSTTRIDAVAVMPFTYQGDRTDAEFLTDGVTESLINNLSQLPNLTVKARSSVFYYKGKDVTLRQVGSELGVQAILTGKIVEIGDSLSLNIEAVNAATGDQIWGQRYERKHTDFATVSNEIARDVTNKLRLRLGVDPIARGQTKDAEAYELYLRGRFLWNKRRQADHERAMELFEKAIARDPNFALAYAAVADVCTVDSYKPPEGVDCHVKGTEYANKALAIEPQLGEAYAPLGNIETSRRNWEKGDQLYLKAIELSPNYADAHHWRGEALTRRGRHDEAIAEMKTALLLDPLSQIMNDDYAYVLLFARRYEEALAQARRSNELNKEWGKDLELFALEYLERYSEGLDAVRGEPLEGHYDKDRSPEKIAEFNSKLDLIRQRLEAEGPDGYWRAWLEITEKEIAEQKSQDYYFKYYQLAICHVKLGQPDKALDALEKRLTVGRNGDEIESLMMVEPHFDPLQNEPRFIALGKKLNLR